jgi:hypothetical protein
VIFLTITLIRTSTEPGTNFNSLPVVPDAHARNIISGEARIPAADIPRTLDIGDVAEQINLTRSEDHSAVGDQHEKAVLVKPHRMSSEVFKNNIKLQLMIGSIIFG